MTVFKNNLSNEKQPDIMDVKKKKKKKHADKVAVLCMKLVLVMKVILICNNDMTFGYV